MASGAGTPTQRTKRQQEARKARIVAAGPRPNASPHAGRRCGGQPGARGARLAAPPCACLDPHSMVSRCDVADGVRKPPSQVGVRSPPGPRFDRHCQTPPVGPGMSSVEVAGPLSPRRSMSIAGLEVLCHPSRQEFGRQRDKLVTIICDGLDPHTDCLIDDVGHLACIARRSVLACGWRTRSRGSRWCPSRCHPNVARRWHGCPLGLRCTF
jgi:hypothetical protein